MSHGEHAHPHPEAGAMFAATAETTPAEFSPPEMLGNVAWQMSDSIVGTVSFYFGISHQSELSKSIYYLVVVVALFGYAIAASSVLEFMRSGMGKLDIRRQWFTQALIKLINISVYYVLGLLARVIYNEIVTAPLVGFFGLSSLFKTFVIIVLIVWFLYRGQMLHSPRREINDALLRFEPPAMLVSSIVVN